MNKLQKSVDIFRANFDKFDKEKSQKKSKIKILESKNLKIYGKIIISEKQIDKQEQHSRRNCILLHDIAKIKGDVVDDIAVKTICKNIIDNIVTVDDINRSHRIDKYDSQKKNLRLLIVKLARYNVWVFSRQYKIKGKQISITKV